MSEPHEPSYYEIALTNRQVTVAFVILLVCLVGAFFSGVWVGRSGAESSAARPAPAPQATNGQAPLEELHFFSDAAKSEKAPAVVPESTAAASPAVSPLAALPTPEVAPPASSPAPVVTPSLEAHKAQPAAKSTPVAAEAVSELAPGEMVVQVFSSPDGEQARKIVARLKSGGFRAFLSPIEKSGKTVYRVRIGPFTDHGAAQKVADQVRKKYRYDTWITR
ncbi:MAG: SPOR domain-containing protein [Acidobacteriota bacterium]